MALIWADAQQPFEAFPLRTLPAHRRGHAPHLEPHPERPDVLVQVTPDGPDYILRCDRHLWASAPLPLRPSACPMCVAEGDATAGRLRYLELQARVALER